VFGGWGDGSVSQQDIILVVDCTDHFPLGLTCSLHRQFFCWETRLPGIEEREWGLTVVDVFSTQKRSQVMAAIKSSGNRSTELTLARIFRRKGIRGWRRNQPLIGRPDFVFRRERVVLFVDGCFWHGCPKHGRRPDSNTEYWDAKFSRNKKRDRLVNRELRKRGWSVVRIWEHELHHEDRLAGKVEAVLRLRSSKPDQEASQWVGGLK